MDNGREKGRSQLFGPSRPWGKSPKQARMPKVQGDVGRRFDQKRLEGNKVLHKKPNNEETED